MGYYNVIPSLIEFHDCEETLGEMISRLEDLGVCGYLFTRPESKNSVFLLSSLNSRQTRKIGAERKAIKIVHQLEGYALPKNHGLSFFVCKPLKEGWINIGKVDRNGFVSGHISCDINDFGSFFSCYIDDEFIYSGHASVFRDHLLKNGVGIGFNGFKIKIPPCFLDGKEHVVSVSSNGMLRESSQVFPLVVEKDLSYSSSLYEKNDVLKIRSLFSSGKFEEGIAVSRDSFFLNPDLASFDIFVYEGFKYRFHCGLDVDFIDYINHRQGFLHAKPSNEIIPAYSLDLRREHETLKNLAHRSYVRDFSRARGLKTPHVYDVISDVKNFDISSLPERFVLKSSSGSGKRVIGYSKGIDLFSRKKIEKREVGKFVESVVSGGGEVLVEDFLVQEGLGESQIPLDYKFHCWGGKAFFLQVVSRNSLNDSPLCRNECWFSRSLSPLPFVFKSKERHSGFLPIPEN